MPSWADAGGQEEPAVRTERESAGKRHYSGRKDIFTGRVQLDSKCHYGAGAAQPDIVSAIWPKIAAPGIQPVNRAGITNNLAGLIDGQDAIRAHC
jgi:hypothetical protein